MRRFIFGLALCAVLGASPAFAQTPVTVFATITDPNGLPYTNAKVSAQLIPSTASPTIIVNGIPTQIGGQQNAVADANGTFSMNLFCNVAGNGCSVISPSGTQWQFTVNVTGIAPPAGFGPQQFTFTLNLSGANGLAQDITASLNVPALALARAGAAGPVAGVAAIDTGGRANGPIGTNWTLSSNGLVITSNNIGGTQSGMNAGFWAANTFPPFQYAQVNISAFNGSDLAGPTVLSQSTGVNFYDCVENTTAILLRKVVNGVPTTLASTASTGTQFDVVRLEYWPNTTLVCSKNGAPILTASDTTFRSGSAGIDIGGTVTTVINFVGGGIVGQSSCTSVTPVIVNTNTTSDQNLMSCILPPASIGAPARTIRMQLAGVYSTPAASTSAITLKVKVCTVAGCGSGTVVTLISITTSALGGIQATNNPFKLESTAIAVPGNAALSTFEAHGNLTIGLSASASAAEAVFSDNNTAPAGTVSSLQLLFLQTSVAFSVADPANSATGRLIVLRGDGP